MTETKRAITGSLLTGLALTMAGCMSGSYPTPEGPPERDGNIVAKVQEAGFKAPRLYSGRLTPGSILTSLGDETLFAEAEDLGLSAKATPAAFLKNWESTNKVDNSFDLEFLLSSSRAKESADIGLALGEKGVTHYTIRIGEAQLEAISDLEIRELLNQGLLPEEAENAIRAGQPVVVEALRVDSIRVTLEGGGERGFSLDLDAVSELFGTHARMGSTTQAGGVPIEVSSPVYIGFKARPLFKPATPPPARATEEEPNEERSDASRVRASGSARGSVNGGSDPFDLWVLEPERSGLLTVVATTSGGGKRARLNRVTIMDDSGKKLAGGSKKPFLPGKNVSFGPVYVESGMRYYIKVDGSPKGVYAEYRIETSLAEK